MLPPHLSLLLLLLLLHLTRSQHITLNSSSFDALIPSLAFPHHRSDQPYPFHLPPNLSSISATALRLRAAHLWRRPTNLGYFRLPPRILTSPHVRRTLLVFYDLGNLSSSFFSVPGYVLLAPVVACLAYDATNLSNVDGVRQVSLRPMRDPITITFPPTDESAAPARCVRFGPEGLVPVGGVAAGGMRCEVRGTGHFSVVAEAPPVERERRRWRVWVWVGIGCGVVGMVGFGVAMWVRKKRRMLEMERRREEGEVLDTVWVGGSKLPAAAVARTTPAIECHSSA